jgi:hypothetical protein
MLRRMTMRPLALPLLLALAACGGTNEVGSLATSVPAEPSVAASSAGSINFTNDRAVDLRLRGCTACGEDGLAVAAGQSQQVTLREGTRVLEVLGGANGARCFRVSYGVLPANALELRASEAGVDC